jgi:AbrB family looped-hinge helix DNA binding protein
MKKKTMHEQTPLKSYRASIAANGRINIPAKIRQLAHIDEGDEVIFEVKDQIIHLISLKKAIEEAQALAALTPMPHSLTEELQLLRQEEIRFEEQRALGKKEK